MRNSAPIRALASKLPSLQPLFNYAGELCDLYATVKPEVARMALLFPEYTPHDTNLHLDRLFPLAELLLGEEFFFALTCDELFLLCTGLIAHDWGMAIGSPEIDALIAGGTLAEKDQAGFALLSDETVQLNNYINERRLPHEGDRCPALTIPSEPRPDEDPAVALDGRFAMQRSPLPEYVRRTHAWRSGARLRRRWAQKYPALADAAAGVCVGHWLDLAKIDKLSPFDAPRPLFGGSAPPNLLAIAVAVRLTDLFDVGIDRTPYALWRYIRPQDATSKREWDKHRCLDPVVTEPDAYGNRAPVLSGKVHDHEVWAALVDLHRYCEDQLRGCIGLMRQRHQRDELERGHPLPWTLRPDVVFKVEAVGFEPCDIRFEFERQSVLTMLSSLLYQGDAYVFLRELLQNAIDATRLRRARHRLEQDNDPNCNPPRGIVYFDVKHGDNGDATITCRDSGIGMDDVTVRNYMAKAGASFWQSDQFRTMNPGFTPIGCFGIGLLSCFSVADEVEVLTRRYDWPDPKTDPLRIRIPNAAQQFRVEKAPDTTPYGTTVKVHVRGGKLREQWCLRNAAEAAKMPTDQHPAPPLQVTEYLKIIAGFVRCPIVIDEHGRRTVIVHPDYERLPETEEDGSALVQLKRETKHKGLEWKGVCRLVRDYDWPRRFGEAWPTLNEDLRAELGQRVVDLKADLSPEMTSRDFNDIEGWLVFPEPTNATREFVKVGQNLWGTDPITRESTDFEKLAGTRPLKPPGSDKSFDVPSAKLDLSTRVYRDGLLIANTKANKPSLWAGLATRITINLSGAGYRLDPSRLNVIGLDGDWTAFVWDGLNDWLKRTEVVQSILASTSDNSQEAARRRFFELGRLGQLFGLSDEWLGAAVKEGEFPVPRMAPSGDISFVLAKDLGAGPHWTAPDSTVFELDWVWNSGQLPDTPRQDHLGKIVRLVDWLPSLNTDSKSAAGRAWNACIKHLNGKTWTAAAQWLVPPVGWTPPIQQVGYVRRSASLQSEFNALAKEIIDEPERVPSDQQLWFWTEVLQKLGIEWSVQINPFSKPFDHLFSPDGWLLNSKHSATGWLLRSLAALAMKNAWAEQPKGESATWGRLVLELFDELTNFPTKGYDPIPLAWANFAQPFDASGLLSGHPATSGPTSDDFHMPNYLPESKPPDKKMLSSSVYRHQVHPWGYPLPPDWKPGDIVRPPVSILPTLEAP